MTTPVLPTPRKALTRRRGGTNKRNLAGQTFGYWATLREHSTRFGARMWECRCRCGSERIVEGRHLTSGRSKSCGCYRNEVISRVRKSHGLTETREYRIWCQMKGRCANPNIPEFANYGGRGITVCDRWLNSFEAFLTDMGNAPDGYSIDRINVNGNYEPSNCRWATPKQQANNTRRNHIIIVNGERITLSEASTRYGINYGTLKWRLRRGQSIEQALRHDD